MNKKSAPETAEPTAKRGPYAKTKARREAIIQAAHEVFAAHGYQGGSLQLVADKVGMSQSSLLHHFPTKSDLLLAVLHLRDEFRPEGMPLTDDGQEALDVIDRLFVQVAFNESIPGVIELYTVLCAESLTQDHPGSDYFTQRFAQVRDSYEAEFRRLAALGELREGVDPARAAASLTALWDGIQTQWLMAPDSVDMAGCLRDYVNLILRTPRLPVG